MLLTFAIPSVPLLLYSMQLTENT